MGIILIYILALFGLFICLRWVMTNLPGLLQLAAMYFIVLPQYRFMSWRIERKGWKHPVYIGSVSQQYNFDMSNPDAWIHIDYWIHPDHRKEDGTAKECPLYTAYHTQFGK